MILSNTPWTDASYRSSPTGTTQYSYSLTIPNLTKYLLVVFGGGASHQSTFDEPGIPQVKTWTPTGGIAAELEVIAAPAVAFDSGPATIILGLPNPVTGSGTLEITWSGRPQVWGTVVAICLSDINTGAAHTPAGIYSETEETGAGTSLIDTLASPLDLCTMISVLSIRDTTGNTVITPGGGQTDLIGQYPFYGFVKVAATAKSGSGASSLACSFALDQSSSFSMSSVLLAPGFSGNQIFVIG